MTAAELPVPLLCLPFAGSGASTFRPWTQRASDVIQVVPVQLAGREERLAEEPHTTVAAAVGELVPQVADALDLRRGLALFGHSLGAVLAFELAHALNERCDRAVARLFVSGSPGPWTHRARRATGLPDGEFLARVAEFAGYRHSALEDEELRALLLPTLRADVRMHEDYTPLRERPLDAPITSFRGADDRLVSGAMASEWARATSREFELVELPGGHMYLADSAEALLSRMEAALGGSRARS